MPADEPKRLDAGSLKALAHPLRMRLLGSLRRDGPATASGLGRRLGESSGATSYHLRHLERHGFVEEDASRGDGRDRWWRSRHRGTTWDATEFDDDPAARAALGVFDRLRLAHWVATLEAWFAERDAWPAVWRQAAGDDDYLLRLDAAQLAALSGELRAVVERHAAQEPGVDAEAVTVQIAAFPRRRSEPS